MEASVLISQASNDGVIIVSWTTYLKNYLRTTGYTVLIITIYAINTNRDMVVYIASEISHTTILVIIYEDGIWADSRLFILIGSG